MTISGQDEVIVTPAKTEQDIVQANHCLSEAFGGQARDALWMMLHPGWDTEEGRATNAREMIKKWKNVTTNKDGQPNTIYLVATVPDPGDSSQRKVAGMAIWKQLSLIEGHGEPFDGDMSAALENLGVNKRRFATQAFRSLWRRRIEYLHEISDPKSGRNPPAIFTLDMCAVQPASQRRGIAAKLVQWGLDEAKRRGNLECTTEGSIMGRGVYRKLGFEDEGTGDIEYHLDEEFQTWEVPRNVFLRTGVRGI